ncbi:GAF domain-containing protein, partial [Streptococcus pneumoniae]|uniref:GAF domain-containing protein n=1 Tax=Streptococcus pneumoniae TaxID=1313 RepID=UPI0013D90251
SSPCALCLDAGRTILVSRPCEAFDYFNAAEQPLMEGLVVPLYDTGGLPLGTLWVVHHDAGKHFDAEDARLMEQLAVQLVLALKLRDRLEKKVSAH